MGKKNFIILVNILLALIIYANGEFGRMLGLKNQALAISLFWPATGFSLAALLLFGHKVAPGIFLGNFIYNLIHLYEPARIAVPLFTALIVTSGSLLQALVGYAIMRRFTSPGYFSQASDVFIFLLPAGLATCLIASTVGSTALYFYRPVSWSTWQSMWLHFWLGDTMGVYLFTPLLVVWTSLKPTVRTQGRALEILGLSLFFCLITYLTFIKEYHLADLYFPLTLWAAYRFRLHGATLVIFIITLVVLALTSIGFGPFSLILQSLSITLVSFLEMMVAVALILAVLANQLEKALNLIQSHAIGMHQSFERTVEELNEKDREAFIKETLSTLSSIKSHIAKQVQDPLRRINTFTQISLETLDNLNTLLTPLEEKVAPELSSQIQSYFEGLKNYLGHILKYETRANRIVKFLEEYASLPSLFEIKRIDINALLEICLENALKTQKNTYPDLTIHIIRHFDKSMFLSIAMPSNFAKTIYHLILNSIDSLSEKARLEREEGVIKPFVPTLTLSTAKHGDKLSLTLKDNGQGLPEATEEENPLIALTIALDFIQELYHGEAHLESQPGDFTELNLLFPLQNSS